MTYDIYYLVYGVKLDALFIKNLIDYVVESEDFDLELIEENCLEDGFVWEKIKNTVNRYDYLDEEFLENYFFDMMDSFYQGDSFVGKEIWSTEKTEWSHTEQANVDNFPKLEISEEDKRECETKVNSLKELLPDELANKLPEIGFYWCIGTS